MAKRAVIGTTVPASLQSFYSAVISEFRRRGYEVHLVASGGPEWESLISLVDQCHIIPMSRRISPLRDIIGLARWWSLLRQIKPAVVLAGTPKAALMAMLAGLIARVPRRIYHLHGLRLEGANGIRRYVLAAMEVLTSVGAHIVVSVSPSLSAEFMRLRLDAGRPVIVPGMGSAQGVDGQKYRPQDPDEILRGTLGLDPNLPVVIFIGRLTADKGIDMLRNAGERLIAQGFDLQFLVLGAHDEPDSVGLVESMRNSTLTVRFAGHQPDVRPYIALSDLLVLPTKREGLPTVVLEAAAMQVPAITTNVTGAVDSVVDGVTGRLVDQGDDVALARAIRELLDDPRKRSEMGISARERVLRHFAPHEVAAVLVDVCLRS